VKKIYPILFVIVLTLRVNSVLAAPPQLLWHRDIPDVFVDSSFNGLEISGNGQTIVAVSVGWEPSTLYVLNGSDGQTLWTLDYDDVTRTFIRASVSDDGQIIAIGDGLYPYNEYFGLEDISGEYGPYETRIFNRDGSLRATIPGGMGMLTPDGTKVYIYGIWYDVQPENDIWKFKHGLFTNTGVEIWSHIFDYFGTVNQDRLGISVDGSTITQECASEIDDTRPENCRDWYASFVVFDGVDGHILFTQEEGPIQVSVSRSGNFIGTVNWAWSEDILYCWVLSREGQTILSFPTSTQVFTTVISPTDDRVACLTSSSLYWMTLQGNLLWTLPCEECWLGSLQISSDNRVLLISYQTPGTTDYRTDIIETSSGTIAHTFEARGKMTLDGTKVVVTDESTYVELWDITPLFQ